MLSFGIHTLLAAFMMGKWLIAAVACFLTMRPYAIAQANMTIESSQEAAHLSGVVHYGEQAEQQTTMKDVAVAECSAHFRDCVTLTKTDENGKFTLQSNRKGKVHYLRFLSLGWCEQHVTLTLVSGSKTLDIELHIGT